MQRQESATGALRSGPVDPYDAARRSLVLEGELTGALPRLESAVAALMAPPAVRVRFTGGPVPGGGDPGIEVHAEARVEMVCQRCLESFQHTLVSDATLRVRSRPSGTADDERMGGNDGQDEIECDPGDRINLRELVEDEMILALPFAPTCERPACGLDVPADVATGEADESPARKENPFAALAALRGTAPAGD